MLSREEKGWAISLYGCLEDEGPDVARESTGQEGGTIVARGVRGYACD